MNTVAWVEGKVIDLVDASGKSTSCECECAEAVGDSESLVTRRRYDRCLSECMTRVGQQIATLNPNANCGYIDGNERKAYGCSYNRFSAYSYAIQYGINAYHNGTPGYMIGAGTDCTNFASQVLFAGGFLLTDNWKYVDSENGYLQVGTTESWKVVNYNMSWLSGHAFSTQPQPQPDLEPLAPIRHVATVNMQDMDQVIEGGAALSGFAIWRCHWLYE